MISTVASMAKASTAKASTAKASTARASTARASPNRPLFLGFSLLELVLALAMAAVLAAYAAPIYVSHTSRGHRMNAILALHRAAQYVAVSTPAAGQPLALPPGLDRSPEHGRAVYRLELVSTQDRGAGYEIVALPAGDGPMRGDACGAFVLDGAGVRSNRLPTGDSTRLDACWSGRPA